MTWMSIDCYAVVTPLRKATSYEPRIAILGILGDTWLTRGKYGIYVAVRGSYGALTGSTWRLLPRKISPIYCRVSYVAVTRIPSLVMRNTWHYVIIRYSYGELPKFILRCSYEAALRKGVTSGIVSKVLLEWVAYHGRILDFEIGVPKIMMAYIYRVAHKKWNSRYSRFFRTLLWSTVIFFHLAG